MWLLMLESFLIHSACISQGKSFWVSLTTRWNYSNGPLLVICMFIYIVVADGCKVYILVMAFATWNRISDTLSPMITWSILQESRVRSKQILGQQCLAQGARRKGVLSFAISGCWHLTTAPYQQGYNQIYLAQFLAVTELLWILLVISRTRL